MAKYVSKYLSRLCIIVLGALVAGCNFNNTNEPNSGLENYVLSTSNVFMKNRCKAKSCDDVHDNILLRNDSLFVEGKINDEWGQFARKLKETEIERIKDYLKAYSNKPRPEFPDERLCGGWTSLYIRKGDVLIDSIADFEFEWNEKENEFLSYIASIVSADVMTNIGNRKIGYPSAAMVSPPEEIDYKIN